MNERTNLVFTDSGLGGLGIMAETAKYFFERKPFNEINLIYFNSSPGNNRGYNKMENEEEKIFVFNNALNSMYLRFKPDNIYIACNTLSVIFHKTKFSQENKSVVTGIVDSGLNVMLEKLVNFPNSRLIILGTPTTISTDTYKKKLILAGIENDRIINQSCPNLESEIQINPDGENVRMLIKKFLEEATTKIDKKKEKIFVALCCTHYGFSEQIFDIEMRNLAFDNFAIINPNMYMVESIKQNFNYPENEKIKINIDVVSKAKISDDEINLIGKQIENISPHLAEALRNYEFDENLF